jgi:hypothetical protein
MIVKRSWGIYTGQDMILCKLIQANAVPGKRICPSDLAAGRGLAPAVLFPIGVFGGGKPPPYNHLPGVPVGAIHEYKLLDKKTPAGESLPVRIMSGSF